MRVSIALILVVFATPAVAFEGSYGSQTGAAWRKATIVPKGAGTYSVDLGVGVPGCVGDLEGAVGKVVGDRLVVDHREEFGACHLDISRSGTGIEIKEGACNMHGGRCSFTGVYPASGKTAAARAAAAPAVKAAAAPAASAAPAPVAPAPRLAGNFYCADPMNVDPARLRDPNYRVKPPTGPAVGPTSYDYFYHAGAFTYSFAGDAMTWRSVKVAIAGTTATYTGPRDARWTVSPVGAATVVIRGKGLEAGEKAVGCVWR